MAIEHDIYILLNNSSYRKGQLATPLCLEHMFDLSIADLLVAVNSKKPVHPGKDEQARINERYPAVRN